MNNPSFLKKFLSRQERARFRNSVPKDQPDGITFYVGHLLPIFIEELAENFIRDPFCGSYALPTTEEDLHMYCTPYWETDEEIIGCSLVDGHGIDRGNISVPFPKGEMTFNPRVDAERFIKAVKHAAVDLDVTLLLNGQG